LRGITSSQREPLQSDRNSVQFYVMSTTTVSPGRYLKTVPVGSFVRVEDLPGSRQAAASAASRAAARGDLLALRKGLYFKGVRTRYGMTAPGPIDVALMVLGTDGVGPAGHSAARVFGLTTQVPARPELAVAGPLPTRLPGVVLRRRNNMARRDLSFREIALLEVLRDWEHLSERPMTALAREVKSGAVDLDRVERALRTERVPAARGRFGELVRTLGARGETA
jgi:hypothetical protein